MLHWTTITFIDKYVHSNIISQQTHPPRLPQGLFTVKHQLTALTRRWLVGSRLRKYQNVCMNVVPLKPLILGENVRELVFWVGEN